ncbi:MAG TPA: hypothetical protein VLA68_04755 [Nitrososphaera sp.]|nr:hypothetical protein [Nitrososphaera sp.]
MMSPYFSRDKPPSVIPTEILAIHEEISLIDLHRTEHVVGFGKVKKLDQSCKYCQPYLQNEVKQIAPYEVILPEANPQQIVNATESFAQNGLERTVDIVGKKGLVTVPRSWAGKKVRVILI